MFGMNIPGFTAEAALYRTNKHYRVATADILTVLSGQVVPQQGAVIPPELLCFHVYLGCINYCANMRGDRIWCYYSCYRVYNACGQINVRLPR